MSANPVSGPNRLLETAPHDRPEERLRTRGAGALSDAELVALLLRKGTRGLDVMTLASQIVADAGSLAGLLAWQESNFRRHRGIGRVKACQLMATMEIARRALNGRSGPDPRLADADGVAAFMRAFTTGLEVEKFWVLCLNRKGRLIKRVEVTSGIASSTLVHPREVFRVAIQEAASSVICVHNHPSGDPQPSSHDVAVTRTLRAAAQAVEIELLDHVIVGQPDADPNRVGHYSFRAAGVL